MAYRSKMKRGPAWKTLLAASIAVASGLFVQAPASAQSQSQADSSANIVDSSRFVNTGDLDFGQIVPGPSGGTITVTPNSNVSTSGTVVSAGGTPRAASFEIERQIFVDYPQYGGPGGGDTITLTSPSAPGQPMTVRDFTTNFSLFGYFFQTNYEFHVGGTLDVGPNQPPGTYTGTFVVTLNNF